MIRLSEVTKEFGSVLGATLGRRVRALDGVDLIVNPGSALGIVGPNGAGKSTLLRLLLGYLRPTRGHVAIAGLPPRQYAEHRGIAYVPERIDVPPRWTVSGALQAYAALGDVEHPRGRIEEMMRRLGIEGLADRRVSTLSKGNLQRLALAQALVGDRTLMVLDEPTDGLDPEWTARTREILAEWRAGDPERVLLFASHNLDEVERVADRAAVLRGGRLVETIELRGAPTTLPPYHLALEGSDTGAADAVREIFPGSVRVPDQETGLEFRINAPDLLELNRRLALLLARGVIVRSLAPDHPSLEQRFRHAMSGEDDGHA